MRVGEFLYFAPGLKFVDISLREEELPSQYLERIIGFYIEPAQQLAKMGHAFGSSLLLVCCIDALAKIEYPHSRVGERFKKYCKTRLPSFSSDNLASLLYESYRNGVVHEARGKDGVEFSLEIKGVVEDAPGGIRVNPAKLTNELKLACEKHMLEIENSSTKRTRFKHYMLVQFKEELS